MSNLSIQSLLESKFSDLKVYKISTKDFVFEERVKQKCFHCENYNSKWTCPGHLPNSPVQRFLLNGKIKVIQFIYKCGRYNYSDHTGCRNFVKRCLKLIVYKLVGGPSQSKLFELYNRVATRFVEHDCQETALLAFHGLSDYWRWNMADQVNTMQMPFEMLSLPIPIRFDPVLRQQYGDYMQFPPENQRECHEYYDFSTEMPYKEYYKQ